jgi:hypothetical protein
MGGIGLALRQARHADEHLHSERARLARERKAQLDLSHVHRIAEIHASAANENVVLSPKEVGMVSAALDALPAEALPSTRAEYHWRLVGGGQPSGTRAERWRVVRDEVSAALRDLSAIAAGSVPDPR